MVVVVVVMVVVVVVVVVLVLVICIVSVLKAMRVFLVLPSPSLLPRWRLGASTYIYQLLFPLPSC